MNVVNESLNHSRIINELIIIHTNRLRALWNPPYIAESEAALVVFAIYPQRGLGVVDRRNLGLNRYSGSFKVRA